MVHSIIRLRYADQLVESIKESSTTQRSKVTEQIFVKKPLLVPVLSANHRNPRRKVLSPNFAAQRQRRQKRSLRDHALTEIPRRFTMLQQWEALVSSSLILAHIPHAVQDSVDPFSASSSLEMKYAESWDRDSVMKAHNVQGIS